MTRFVAGLAAGLVVGLVAGAAAMVTIPARPDPPPIVHVHSSSLYSRPAATLVQAFTDYAVVADLVTWTEVPPRGRALRRSGWGAYSRPARTDVAVSWRRTVWTPEARWITRLAPRQVAAWLLLIRSDGLRVLVTVAHMPAHVELGDRFRPGVPGRVATWQTAVTRWAAQVRAARRQDHPDRVIVAADWNIDLRRPVWRRYLLARFPGLRVTWARPLPRVGTHRGGRLIDATLTNARGRARLLPDDRSSDHRPYVERLR